MDAAEDGLHDLGHLALAATGGAGGGRGPLLLPTPIARPAGLQPSDGDLLAPAPCPR